MDLFEKCDHFETLKLARKLQVYPYFHELESRQAPVVQMENHRVIMLGSNNYLGFTENEAVIKAGHDALDKYGTGVSGSRFLNGTLDLHLQLERELAEFTGYEECMTVSTGFQTNLAIISAICGKDDYILNDRENHASIYDACRLSFAKVLRYRHSDMQDLERQLQSIPENAGKLIVTDGVFSMRGDICKLPEICALAEKYHARVMVDDAHGFGVLGPGGRGTAAHFGLTDKVDITMLTFSKSLASIGGFVAADKVIINYLRHTARTYIFSASDTPAATASALEALHIIQKEPKRIKALWEVTNYALMKFRDAGFEIGDTESPIIPLYVRDLEKTFMVTKMAFDEGVFINAVIPPACAPTDTLVRFALMATHTKEQVDRAVTALTKVFKELNIIQ